MWIRECNISRKVPSTSPVSSERWKLYWELSYVDRERKERWIVSEREREWYSETLEYKPNVTALPVETVNTRGCL